jgi:hypothetical protein
MHNHGSLAAYVLRILLAMPPYGYLLSPWLSRVKFRSKYPYTVGSWHAAHCIVFFCRARSNLEGPDAFLQPSSRKRFHVCCRCRYPPGWRCCCWPRFPLSHDTLLSVRLPILRQLTRQLGSVRAAPAHSQALLLETTTLPFLPACICTATEAFLQGRDAARHRHSRACRLGALALTCCGLGRQCW